MTKTIKKYRSLNMDTNYDLIISIVSYNSLKESIKISRLIEKQLKGFSFKILLVENGNYNYKHEFSLIKEGISKINIHHSKNNIGYAAGHNWNISNYFKELKNNGFFLILNNDINIEQINLVRFLKKIQLNKLDAVSPTQIIKGFQSYPRKTLLFRSSIYDHKNKNHLH